MRLARRFWDVCDALRKPSGVSLSRKRRFVQRPAAYVLAKRSVEHLVLHVVRVLLLDAEQAAPDLSVLASEDAREGCACRRHWQGRGGQGAAFQVAIPIVSAARNV
eukprot:scaffold1376_cov257-Pinguiococcus_pyrenoidosus.AAC.13